MAFLDDNGTGGRVGNVGQGFTVALHRHFFRSRFVWGGVVPGHAQYLFRVRTTLLGIHLAQTQEDTGEDFTIGNGNPRGIRTFPVPLQPATGVDDRTVLFGEAGGRQTEYFGLDFRRVNIVRLTVVLPEGGGLCVERVDGDQELQFGQ